MTASFVSGAVAGAAGAGVAVDALGVAGEASAEAGFAGCSSVAEANKLLHNKDADCKSYSDGRPEIHFHGYVTSTTLGVAGLRSVGSH
jgi:hypothetical protein